MARYTTVKNLIDALRDQDPEAIAILSKDEDGEWVTPVFDLTAVQYCERSPWRGDIIHDKSQGQKAVCFWPSK